MFTGVLETVAIDATVGLIDKISNLIVNIKQFPETLKEIQEKCGCIKDEIESWRQDSNADEIFRRNKASLTLQKDLEKMKALLKKIKKRKIFRHLLATQDSNDLKQCLVSVKDSYFMFCEAIKRDLTCINERNDMQKATFEAYKILKYLNVSDKNLREEKEKTQRTLEARTLEEAVDGSRCCPLCIHIPNVLRKAEMCRDKREHWQALLLFLQYRRLLINYEHGSEYKEESIDMYRELGVAYFLSEYYESSLKAFDRANEIIQSIFEDRQSTEKQKKLLSKAALESCKAFVYITLHSLYQSALILRPQ